MNKNTPDIIFIIYGILAFPIFIFGKSGINWINKVHNYAYILGLIIIILVYTLFVIFVKKIKTISKKWLYIISAIILLLALIGIKGCVQIWFGHI